MKLLITTLLNLLDDYKDLSLHSRLNRIIHFVEAELPIMIDEMTRFEREYEDMKKRLRELEESN